MSRKRIRALPAVASSATAMVLMAVAVVVMVVVVVALDFQMAQALERFIDSSQSYLKHTYMYIYMYILGSETS